MTTSKNNKVAGGRLLPILFAGSVVCVAALLSAACGRGSSFLGDAARASSRITPEASQAYPAWTADEKAKDAAIRPISATKEASYHLAHIRTAEKPHLHKEHDTFVVVVSGAGIVHYADKAFPVHAGDSVEIPRMVPHWVENKGDTGMTAYVIFSPPFDGKDRVFLEK